MVTVAELKTKTSSESRATPVVQQPINLKNWIAENSHLFKPPVSNRYLYDGRDFFEMVIKGPNARNVFHSAECTAFAPATAGHDRRGGRAAAPPGEKEHVIFYCENCGALVEDIHFDCADIVEHFSKAMLDFWNDAARQTCKKCGKKVEKPEPMKSL